ncbi:unnamed protein product [Rotaria sordida]|uniref:Uncharacterized protein n=1 Tax=Rotaria sordida TaxID=392033 RepID=A0A820I6I0_9BILA|nr:unnamed protein product [Rotaria sordida]
MANSSTTVNDQQSFVWEKKYHTVPIRSDLSEIRECYDNQPPKDLPPSDFWIDRIKCPFLDKTSLYYYKRDKQENNDRQLKLLYCAANGPLHSYQVEYTPVKDTS